MSFEVDRNKVNSFSESGSLSTWNPSINIPYAPRFKYILYLFVLIIFFDFLAPFTTDIYNPALPIISNDLINGTEFLVQLSLILFTIFHCIAQIIFTSLINDCFNLQYRYIIIIGLFIYIISSLSFCFSQSSFPRTIIFGLLD